MTDSFEIPKTAQYLCTKCRKSFLDRPTDGICPNCPDEPVFDVSTREGRRTVATLIEEAELDRKGRIGTIGMFVGAGVGLAAALVFLGWVGAFDEDSAGSRLGLYMAAGIFVAFVGLGSFIESAIRGEEKNWRWLKTSAGALVVILALGFWFSQQREESTVYPVSRDVRHAVTGPLRCELSAGRQLPGRQRAVPRYGETSPGGAWQVEYKLVCATSAPVVIKKPWIALEAVGPEPSSVSVVSTEGRLDEEQFTVEPDAPFILNNWLPDLLRKSGQPAELRVALRVAFHPANNEADVSELELTAPVR